jgi:hypothetical protein
MVNTGQMMSNDYILRGVPNKRLIVAGVADQKAVLIYLQGGYVDIVNVAVFSHGEHPGWWGARITDYRVKEISHLKRALAAGQFELWTELSNSPQPRQ